MAYIAGVQEQVRRNRKCVDLVERQLQRPSHILVRGLVEADVAVADLDEAETSRALRVTPPPAAPVAAAKSLEVGTPPAIVHRRPVPAHAMQLRKLRRSIPSLATTSGWLLRQPLPVESLLLGCTVIRVLHWVNPPSDANCAVRNLFLAMRNNFAGLPVLICGEKKGSAPVR